MSPAPMTEAPQVSTPAAPELQLVALQRRGVRLEWTTIVWNTIEAVVAVGSGVAAHSIALVAFGLDSAIEIFSAAVTLWELRGSADEGSERHATRLIALSLFTLATYVSVDAVISLV